MRFNSEDIVILIFSVTVSILLLTVVFNNVINKTEISEAKAQLLTTVVSSVVTIISIYVGKKLNKDK